MKDIKYTERISDAEKLTDAIASILEEMSIIEEEFKNQLSPFRQKIKDLEQEFLDKHLVDCNGNPVRIGMIIELDGKKYRIGDRYQQRIFRYLGNARVSAIPEGKKRAIDIYARDLISCTIISEDQIEISKIQHMSCDKPLSSSTSDLIGKIVDEAYETK